MKILMLTTHPTVRGPMPKYIPPLVAGLRELGCSVSLEYWGRHSDTEPIPARVFGRARDLLHVQRRLATEPFDVMVLKTGHDWWTLPRDLALLALARRHIRPIVIQFQGSHPELLATPGKVAFRSATRWLVRLADASMLSSREELVEFKRLCPSGIFFTARDPYVSIAPEPEPKDRGPSTNGQVILFVGRFIREKGVLDLLRAVALLKDRERLHLHLVGDGPLKAEIREAIRTLGLDGVVSLPGYLEGEPLVAAYRSADIFVLPSWSEGFARVLTEAMDAGLPIVTTGIRGAVDHLEHGRNALLVPVRDPVALAGAIGSLLSDAGLRERMSEQNRRKLEAFAPKVVADEYLGILNDVLRSVR